MSRRAFLQLSLLSLGSLAFRSLSDWLPPGEGEGLDFIGVGRVTIREMNIYTEPSYESEVVGYRKRDQLIPLYEEIISPFGPTNNPRWYRLQNGFAHTAYLQRVEDRKLNPSVAWVPEEGHLGEITVPYTRAFRLTQTYGWVPLYRLYYQSVHWITDVEPGPNERAWYKITDELLKIHYHVPSRHVRLIKPKEIKPISPEIPHEQKRIEVSLREQTLTAYEAENIVLHTQISSGIPSFGPTTNGIPTHTPSGRFNIDIKVPSKHMGNGNLTDNIHAYELPGVPWCCFFHETGVAFHGTYWHDNFGRKMSHGCVNMRMDDAKWLYRWTKPEAESHDWVRKGFGTSVKVN
ncbi:MAG: L,D-transpeptidase family protein [Anaerolineales bacterium]